MTFTSDLSVSEFALAAEAGMRPLRLVGGAGVFCVPPPQWNRGQYLRPGQTILLPGEAASWNYARDTVLARLREEAAACQAQVVTGVDVRWQVPPGVSDGAGKRAWYQAVTATGTAIAIAGGGAGVPPPDGGGPVLTNLRVPDYRKLTARGSVPVGLVTATAIAGGRSAWDVDLNPQPGSAAWQHAADHPPDYSPRTLRDREEYHVLMRKAYTAALEKLRADAAPLGATGITAIRIERTRAKWEGTELEDQTVVFVHATGTAIAPSAHASQRPSSLVIMPIRNLNT